jgi:hypothetical protein
MKHIKTFESFLNESTAKYVFWDLYSRDNKKIESCSVTFHNKLEFHSDISNAMEQHHPKLFTIESGRYVRTKLATDLGVIPPSDSYSLRCGIEKSIKDFLQFWEDEGYSLVYNESTDNEDLFDDYIKKTGLTKFAKEKI